jgi:PAS domain S-box-containing protein
MSRGELERELASLRERVATLEQLEAEHERTQEALRELEERWRYLVESAPIVVLVVDRQGTILFLNRTPPELPPRESFLGTTVYDHIPPERREVVSAAIESVFQTGEDRAFETEGPEIGGVIPTYEFRAGPVTKGDQVFGVILAGVDVTDQKQAEQALKEREARYHSLVEDQTELICRWLPDQTLTFVNEAYCRYFDKRPEELLGHTFVPLIPDEDHEVVRQHLGLLSPRNRNDVYEHRVIRADGQLRWMQWTNRAILDDQGRLVEMQGLGKDITDRKQAEQALRESQALYHSIVNDQTEFIVRFLPDGRLTFTNEAMRRHAGMSSDELLGTSISSFISQESWGELRERLTQVTPEDPFFDFECEVFLEDRPETWHRWVQRGIFGADGSPVEFQGVGRDVTDRKRIEDALRESEERYRAIFEQAENSIMLFDMETGTFVDFNESAHKNLGYSREEFQRLSLSEIDAGDNEELARHAERVLRDGGDSFETQQRRKDGELRDFIVVSKLLPLSGKRLVLCMCHDVTERKRAEEALRESEERYRAIFEQSTNSIFLFDPVTREKIDFNRNAYELLGYSCEEFRELDLERIDLSRNVEQDMKLISAGGTATFESKHRMKSGELRDVLVNVKGVSVGGRPMGLGVAQDITEQKQSERALQESEERYRALFDQSSEAIALLDPKTGDFVDFNRRAHERLGYTREEFQKLGPVGIFSGFDPGQLFEYMRQLMREGREHVFKRKDRAKSGKLLDIEVRIGFVSVGRRTLLLSVSRDITDQERAKKERSQLEARLQHTQKLEALGEVAAGVAHEFNNLLVGVVGNAELLLRQEQLAKQAGFRPPLEDILRSGQRAAVLTDQLLAFGRKKKPRVTLVDMNRVITSGEAVLERLMGKRKTVETFLTEDLWRIRADEGEMEQVIMNLGTNARDAMEDGGVLRIETRNVTLDKAGADGKSADPSGPYVEISVVDTGCGMSKEVAERAFEPFYTTKAPGTGTGLGLSLISAMIERAGGHIVLKSRLGEGTRVELYLPKAGDPAKPATVHAEASSSEYQTGGDETILLCDDDEVVRRAVSSLLERYGYRVMIAEGGREALDLLSSHQGEVSLLLTDVVMPGMDGKALVKRATRESPGLKVIYMSGYTSGILRGEGENWRFLQKPVSGDALLQLVRQVLEGRDDRSSQGRS